MGTVGVETINRWSGTSATHIDMYVHTNVCRFAHLHLRVRGFLHTYALMHVRISTNDINAWTEKCAWVDTTYGSGLVGSEAVTPP
jgi:hypothetical protein